ncbi:cation:proton antiporter [Aspergillus candidus]|uniref:Na+/H+ exchanger family protein n=1 Tax=Aspergillus candidus TaxID=41067 RepID=A0A2I2F5H0_ASPCN|nr:Na+/H+ exchanger family protein [Aspergillus candidus]PLB35863.1 Na+/H+ exchanger family protein [Aspergillus candidus]
MAGGFLPYHEPGVVEILIIISFFFFLSLAKWVSAKIIQAGIIGQIAVGIIYGVPLANILEHTWQETFLVLGYVGLILIIFEGGLSARLDLLKQNFWLSMIGAATGVCFPIGLSYLLLYLGFGYGAVETFIIGAALSATSLGTTFAVLASASTTVNLSQTRVGSVLVSAAVIDDVVGLVMSSVIGRLGELSKSEDVNLGWLIGRPIVASVAMAVATPILTKYCFAPFFRRYIEYHFARFDHISNIILMVLVLSAFVSISGYAGTSVLFGSFLAGTFISYLPSKHPEGPFVVMSREEGEREIDKSPTFVHTFEVYLLGVQQYLMEPLFFASIGFAIPFVQLWTGKRIWRGIVFTLLMAFAKFIVGAWIILWKLFFGSKPHKDEESLSKAKRSEGVEPENSPDHAKKDSDMRLTSLTALLLGSAMVARGEIGLLIIEIGINETPYVSEEGFITGVWAILLNTIIGPVGVGLLVRFYGKEIAAGKDWGTQEDPLVAARSAADAHGAV